MCHKLRPKWMRSGPTIYIALAWWIVLPICANWIEAQCAVVFGIANTRMTSERVCEREREREWVRQRVWSTVEMQSESGKYANYISLMKNAALLCRLEHTSAAIERHSTPPPSPLTLCWRWSGGCCCRSTDLWPGHSTWPTVCPVAHNTTVKLIWNVL